MTLPLIGVDARLVADIGPLLISFFLPLHALAELITMTEYRREVVRLVGLRKFVINQKPKFKSIIFSPVLVPSHLSQMTFITA